MIIFTQRFFIYSLVSLIILGFAFFSFFSTPTTHAQTPDCNFTRDLSVGSRGGDVNCLQEYLQGQGFFPTDTNTTQYFGPATQTALRSWQLSEGISPAQGYFGSVSISIYQQQTGEITQTISNTQDTVRSELQEQIRSLMRQVISLLQQKLAQTLDQAGIDRSQFADALGDNTASRSSNNRSTLQRDNSSNNDTDDSDEDEEDSGGGGGGGSSSSSDDSDDDSSGGGGGGSSSNDDNNDDEQDDQQDNSDDTDDSEDSRAGDEAALEALYSSTNGNNWDNNSGWGSSGMDISDNIYGVTTETIGGELRVTEIRLKSNNLNGEIPEIFGNLKELTHLRVKGNSITGPIDTFIDDLESAEWLSFSAFRTVNGQDDRQIDDLVRFNHEGKDGDAYNGFTGSLPDSIANLDNLRMLEISGSHLTGTLPSELPPNIQALFIQSNDMNGDLPPAWGNANNLTHLYINQNYRDSKYTGTIPEEWSSLTNMAWFTFKGNNFDGPLPEFTEWTDLRLFAGGGGNELGGEFPFWLMTQDDKHRSLHTLELGGTGFTGELPEDVSPYFNPSTFSIMNNNLTGNIPDWFEDQFEGIVQILWTGNSFSGSFPDVSNFSDLRFIEVAGNEFTGSLPEIDPNNGTLNIVSFHNNNFTGTIPESWGQVTDGVFRRGMRIPGNELEGKIPARLGEVIKNRFNVRDNKFVFADLIEVVEMLQSASDFEDDRGIEFAPQKPFGDSETITLSPGQTFNYDFSDKSHPHDSYQWTKDGNNISGETSISISINNVDSGDAGNYRLEISNPFGSVEDGDGNTLGTLKSEPITLQVGSVQGIQTTSLQQQLDVIREKALDLLSDLQESN